ncbi:hypothetical protein SETIT_6G194400v2 [Setaria italica]|uniref:F-box associated beta-propeller type 3 domain-containing protein n=1 Tax=Setaria italica TaxID=4555 RepID=K3YLJ4_SETIT|nr:hypothetical protein SETIT_6G194400v2 [Setaria italica]
MTTVSSWRDVIAERTPERHAARAKILAFFSEAGTSRAVVFPDDQQDGGGTGGQERTFTSSKSSDGGVVRLVGTCNGLLCLRDDVPVPGAYRTLSSTIAVANPITGEKVAIPQGSMSWEHYRSRRYKVVNISCNTSSSSNQRLAIDVVRVFTLGESEWREVPLPLLAPDTSYHDSGDVVAVDGSTYWLTARADRVMALDLEDERVASFEAPPCLRLLQVPEKATCQLTNVHGRLGVLVTRHQPTATTRVDVWVLEGGGRRLQPRWSRRRSLLEPGGAGQGRWIASPHFTHGEYVLSKREDERWAVRARWLYRRKVGDLTNGGGKNAELWPLEGAELIVHTGFNDGGVVTFPYAETTEPLPT